MAELFSDQKFIARAREAEHWPAIAAFMEPPAPDYKIFKAVAEASTALEAFRNSFYKVPLPHGQPGVAFASDHADLRYTFSSGVGNARLMSRTWKEHRESKPEYRVLDFGAGTGRILRFVCEFGEGIRPIGCEVNPFAVAWLQQNMPCPVHQLTGYSLAFLEEPPDFIYAWSIFTHFSEAEHLKWLRALTDALAPGGTLFATFKVTDKINRLETDAAYRKTTGNVNIPFLKTQMASGYAFDATYDPARAAAHGVDPKTFGQAYISHDYIRARWSAFGRIAAIGTAVEGWQDFAVLRKDQ